MSTQASNTALALHEILVSISDSLNEAQNQLRNMPPYDQYGRPNTLYQLPYLDFSLEVISELNTQTQTISDDGGTASNDNNTIAHRNYEIKRIPALLFKPVSPTTTSNNSSTNKITSTISGRFVAIMPNEGLPQVFLTLTSELNDGVHKLIAKMQLASGEPVQGQKIEFNYDANNSAALNETSTPPDITFLPNANEEVSWEGFTDSNGIFKIEFSISGVDATGTHIFVANSGTIFKSIAVTN